MNYTGKDRSVSQVGQQARRGIKPCERKIELVMDSGANDSFLPVGMFTDYPIKRTANAGNTYKAADGGRITTLGEKFLRTKQRKERN